MPATVTLPLWLAALLAFLAAWAALERLLVPGVRWFLRRRVRRVLLELDRRLPIRIQPFKLARRRVLIDRLVWDPRVLQAVEEEILASGAPRDVVLSRVRRYAREIVPAFNAYFYFRVGYWIARRVGRALYRVRLGSSDDAALAAVPKNATVVFVMNHRSNMDYVLVSYLAAEKTALSYAVGEWARVWPLQTLIRATGAYFVRRDSRNPLYRRVLERYVAMATAEGVTQAVFPEGGLSRDGRLRPPRLGLYDYMLRGFDPVGARDLVFVPVGLNYDRTLEDRTLLLDLDAGTRKKGPLEAAARTAAFLAKNAVLLARQEWHRFGYACVNFGAPVSLRAFLAGKGLDPRALGKDERIALVAELAGELMRSIGRVIPVLPVSVVSAVFVRSPQRAFSLLEVKGEALALLSELEARGARIYVPRGDQDYAFGVGLRMLTLRRLVEESGGLYSARHEELPLLTYYANSLAHHLGPEAPERGTAA